jgi:predicted DNA-binding transcriptional regulator AlpA
MVGSVCEQKPHDPSREPSTPRKLLDIKEVEAIYGLKRWAIRTCCSQRKIPHIKIGQLVYFNVDAIEAWIKEHELRVREVS